MLDGSSSTRSGSCVSTHAVKPSLPVAIAAMMTPPDAGEEEASSRHGEKSKTKSNINLYISGYVNNPHKANEDTLPYAPRSLSWSAFFAPQTR